MKTGDIWANIGTSFLPGNEYLHDTYHHFAVTVDVLDGEWTKIEKPRELRHRKKYERYWGVVNTHLYIGVGTWKIG